MNRRQWIDEINYQNDARVEAARQGSLWGAFNECAGVLAVEVYDDDGETSEVVDFPAKFEVCDLCRGRGKHVNPAIDASGISPHEFAEDPDFAESYFAGHYDVPCAACDGKRVVPAIDEAACKGELADALKRHHRQEAENAHWDAVARAERMMGA